MSPLPPPPNSLEKASSRNVSVNHDELTLGASQAEIELAASPEVPPGPKPEEPHHEKTLATRILGFFRGTTATGVESKQGIDRMRAAIGSRHARNRVGVLQPKGKTSTPVGPVEFNARYKGKRGAVVIDSSKDSPILYFTTDIPQNGDLGVENRKKGSVYFTIPVSDILEMKKLGGMGWKGKLVVGWAIGSKEVVDGLLIQGKEPNQTYQLTAMVMRNQLFNRLIAIDGQVWETF
jgi:Protein of unknown function (DUF3292).